MAKGTKVAGKVAGKVKGAAAAMKGEHGIFRRLKEEHAAVSMMMKRISAATDGEKRRELFIEMKRELLSHAKGEEREVYTVFQNIEATSDLVPDSIEDHRAIEQGLDQLSSMDFASEEWAENFEELVRDVEDHVETEENEVFPLAQTAIDAEQAKDIEQRYLTTKTQLMRQVA